MGSLRWDISENKHFDYMKQGHLKNFSGAKSDMVLFEAEEGITQNVLLQSVEPGKFVASLCDFHKHMELVTEEKSLINEAIKLKEARLKSNYNSS